MASKYENLLESGSGNVVQSFFDNFLKSNADFRSKAGLKMTVIRESIGVCCDWCQGLVGTYDYDSRPSDIYARHKNCNCIVVTKTERGTYQDAWSRKEYESQRDARIARIDQIIADQGINKNKLTISAIEKRNSFRGKPQAIEHYKAELNSRQKNILSKLPDYGSEYIFDKNEVSMIDLAALTSDTGVEFSMFTRGSQRLIVRGNSIKVNIDVDKAEELYKNGYKWSGHTHPGTDDLSLQASNGDYLVLQVFNQTSSVIYNSMGHFLTFYV